MKNLTNVHRCQIKAYLDGGKSKTYTATSINENKSLICSEIKTQFKKKSEEHFNIVMSQKERTYLYSTIKKK